LLDKGSMVFFMITSAPSSEPVTALDAAETMVLELPFTKVEYSEPYEVEAANNVMLEAVDTAVGLEQGEIAIRVLYHKLGSQDYLITIMAAPDSMADRETTINKLIGSIEFYTPSLFATDPKETVNLLGYEPDEKELDPARTHSGASSFVGILYSGLVRLSPAMQIEADLAESWTISPDGKVYTFILRENLQFADGSPLTAEDVQKSWERAANPETESDVAATYLGDIAGFQQVVDGDADSISGLELIDERTIQVTLKEPVSYFLAKLTYPTSFVVDVSQTDDSLWVWEPNASGPYVFSEYIEQTGMLFERNEKYHNPPEVRYLAYNLNPGGSNISLYEADRLDVAYLDSEGTLRIRDENDPLHGEWQSTASMCTSVVQMNNNIEPFDDLKVRQAFLQAIDLELYHENLFQSTNMIARTILPPAMPGYSSELAPLPFDPAAAKALLAESSYAGNLPEITVSASGYSDSQRPDVDALVEMWKTNLGVKVNVVFLDPLDFTSAAKEDHGHLVVYGWCADYPDPGNFLDILYHSESNFNVAGYSNPDVDSLLEKARSELDPATRIGLYQEAERMLIEDGAVIPLLHSVSDVLVKPRLLNFILSPISTADGIGWSLANP
jgi:oligopeptide transport system substrate-binding protein